MQLRRLEEESMQEHIKLLGLRERRQKLSLVSLNHYKKHLISVYSRYQRLRTLPKGLSAYLIIFINMILLLGAFSSAGFGIYYYSEDLKKLLIDLIVEKSKIIIKHELKQRDLIDLGSSNLKQLTEDYVLKNEVFVGATAELIEQAFITEETHDAAQDLFIKALMNAGAQANIRSMFEYQALCRHFSSYVTRRVNLEDVLVETNIKKT